MADGRKLEYVNLTTQECLDLIDATIALVEPHVEEFSPEDAEVTIEVANRLNALANHFRPMMAGWLPERFPHVPDEVLVDPVGAHEGAPFPVFVMGGSSQGDPGPIFVGGDPITGPVLGARILLDEE